jgi:UDP-N-acetylglucosamine 2-epimerase
VLAGTDAQRIVDAASRMLFVKKEWQNPYGDGKAGVRIVSICCGATSG